MNTSESQPIWQTTELLKFEYENITLLSRTEYDVNISSIDESAPRTLLPLALIAVLILSVIANALTCITVRLDKELHCMTYYFVASMTAVNIVMAVAVMPSSIVVQVHERFIYSEEACKLWVTLDFFFCNNLCLHLAFANMDTFLRLKDPVHHGRTVTTCSISLWLGAPWSISIVQGMAQLMLSQGDHEVIRGEVCFISDKNFVILGTLFSFIIPTAISIIFYAMCTQEIRIIQSGKYLGSTSLDDDMRFYRHPSGESIPEEETSGSIESSNSETLEIVQSGIEQEIRLSKVEDNNDDDKSPDDMTSSVPNNNTMVQSTSFCEETRTSSIADLLQSTSEQNSSCILLLRDPALDHQQSDTYEEHQHPAPDASLRYEYEVSRLLSAVMATTLLFWLPLSCSDVIYGLCTTCRLHMGPFELNFLRWLAYSSSLATPLACIYFSVPVRQAFVRMVTCSWFRVQH